MNRDKLKQKMRQDLRHERASLVASYREEASNATCHFLLMQSWVRYAGCTGYYLASAQELSVTGLMQQQLNFTRSQLRVSLPVIQHPTAKIKAGSMKLCRYNNGAPLRLNRFGLLEPESQQPIFLWQHALLFIPLLGFDRRGTRLGMGGGYYDRLLAQKTLGNRRPLLVGVGFACQEREEIPRENWDVCLDAVVTENEFIRCSKRASSI